MFLTGHTGFKGSWLTIWLNSMGASVNGYALDPDTYPNLYQVAKVDSLLMRSYISDIRDLNKLTEAMMACKPDIVIHMAAQALVRYSYDNPVETYATNVMGTVNVLEAIRQTKTIRSTIVVTSDKCYENQEWLWGYRENEPMGGSDPYSSSKGCAELVTNAYIQSYFSKENYSLHQHALASARAGNVIGGGDWSTDRLLPDAIKAFESNQTLVIRNPLAVRPWQHVLEPLYGYLILAQALYEKGIDYVGAWNFGPKDEDARSVKEIVEILIGQWGSSANWQQDLSYHPHEALLLKLDCSKAKNLLGWEPKWGLEKTISMIVNWHHEYREKTDMLNYSIQQITQFQNTICERNKEQIT